MNIKIKWFTVSWNEKQKKKWGSQFTKPAWNIENISGCFYAHIYAFPTFIFYNKLTPTDRLQIKATLTLTNCVAANL